MNFFTNKYVVSIFSFLTTFKKLCIASVNNFIDNHDDVARIFKIKIKLFFDKEG